MHGWDRVVVTEATDRGAKLVAFVLHMADDTSLVYGSISNYLAAGLFARGTGGRDKPIHGGALSDGLSSWWECGCWLQTRCRSRGVQSRSLWW